jgi:hypothetical protein
MMTHPPDAQARLGQCQPHKANASTALVVLQSVFSVMLFVPTALAAHCFLLLEWIIFLADKSKNQRAAPTAQKQKDTPEKTA